MKSAAVLYHYPCPDGVFAALAAHLYFSSTSTSTPVMFFPNTVYSPLTPSDLPLHQISDLYLLDFIGPPSFIPNISPFVDRLIVLDHHKTALHLTPTSQQSLVIDMARSGATIAFDYFRHKLTDQSAIREFTRLRHVFERIEDGDLWRWNIPNNKAFYNGLKDCKIEFDCRINPGLFDQLRDLDVEAVIQRGIASFEEKQRLIDHTLERSFEIQVPCGEDFRCLAVRADAIPELRSDLGHQLACKSSQMGRMRVGAVVYKVAEMEDDGRLKVSLRSHGEVDTTQISEKFGGGGHRNASSFMIDAQKFESWKNKP